MAVTLNVALLPSSTARLRGWPVMTGCASPKAVALNQISSESSGERLRGLAGLNTFVVMVLWKLRGRPPLD